MYLNAATLGDLAIVRQSIEDLDSPLNVNCLDYMGRSAIHLAVDCENMDMVELLLERINYELVEEALLHAISKGSTKLVKVHYRGAGAGFMLVLLVVVLGVVVMLVLVLVVVLVAVVLVAMVLVVVVLVVVLLVVVVLVLVVVVVLVLMLVVGVVVVVMVVVVVVVVLLVVVVLVVRLGMALSWW